MNFNFNIHLPFDALKESKFKSNVFFFVKDISCLNASVAG